MKKHDEHTSWEEDSKSFVESLRLKACIYLVVIVGVLALATKF